MQYEELKQTIEERYEREKPFDLSIDCQKIRYIFDQETKQPYLLQDNAKNSLFLSDLAHDQLLTKLGLPNSYLKKCSSELKENNVNYFLSKTKKQWKFRVINENLVRAIVNNSYIPIDNLTLIDFIEPFLKNRDVTISDYLVNENMTSIRFVFEEKDDKTDDIVRKGIVVQNSEVGYIALQFRGLLYRSKDKNYFIFPKSMGGVHFRHRGDELRILKICASIMFNIKSEFNSFYDSFQRLKEVKIEDPFSYIKNLCNTQRWPNQYKNYFISSCNNVPNKSMYNIVNALTIGAQNLSLHERAKIEEFSANLVIKTANSL